MLLSRDHRARTRSVPPVLPRSSGLQTHFRAGAIFHGSLAPLILFLFQSRPECRRVFRSPLPVQFALSAGPWRRLIQSARACRGVGEARDFRLRGVLNEAHFLRRPAICPWKAAFPKNPGRPAWSRAPPFQCWLVRKSTRWASSRRPSLNPQEVPGRSFPASPRRKELRRSFPCARVPAHGWRYRTQSLHARPDEMRGKEKPTYWGRRQRVAGELCAASIGPLRCVSQSLAAAKVFGEFFASAGALSAGATRCANWRCGNSILKELQRPSSLVTLIVP